MVYTEYKLYKVHIEHFNGKKNCYDKMKGFSLAVGLEGNEPFPEGLVHRL